MKILKTGFLTEFYVAGKSPHLKYTTVLIMYEEKLAAGLRNTGIIRRVII